MSPQRQDTGQQARVGPRPDEEQQDPAGQQPRAAQHQRQGQQSGSPSTRPAAPAAGSRPAPPRPAPPPPGPRRVRLTVSRVDPWSVMKLAFLLSVAIGIALVVATAVLWSVLDGMGVYADVNRVVSEILADPGFDIHEYIGFSRVVSLVTVIAVVDVVLATAIATLVAFLYNLASALVGGLHVTLSDD